MSQQGSKRCSICKVVKSFADFMRDRTHTDGLRCECKACSKARDAARKPCATTIAKRKARDAQRVVDPKRKRAKDLLRAALKRGDIQRWPVCAMPDCESTDVEAHHADYDNPLGVTWLCKSHHRLLHAPFIDRQARRAAHHGQ